MYHKKKRRAFSGPPLSNLENGSSAEDALQLFFDLHLGDVLGDRQLLDDEVLRRVEHAALAERQRLGRLEAIQVAEHLGHLEEAAGLDLLHETAIAAGPAFLFPVGPLFRSAVGDLSSLLLPSGTPATRRPRRL